MEFVKRFNKLTMCRSARQTKDVNMVIPVDMVVRFLVRIRNSKRISFRSFKKKPRRPYSFKNSCLEMVALLIKSILCDDDSCSSRISRPTGLQLSAVLLAPRSVLLALFLLLRVVRSKARV